jgi:hypothetical protein
MSVPSHSYGFESHGLLSQSVLEGWLEVSQGILDTLNVSGRGPLIFLDNERIPLKQKILGRFILDLPKDSVWIVIVQDSIWRGLPMLKMFVS